MKKLTESHTCLPQSQQEAHPWFDVQRHQRQRSKGAKDVWIHQQSTHNGKHLSHHEKFQMSFKAVNVSPIFWGTWKIMKICQKMFFLQLSPGKILGPGLWGHDLCPTQRLPPRLRRARTKLRWSSASKERFEAQPVSFVVEGFAKLPWKSPNKSNWRRCIQKFMHTYCVLSYTVQVVPGRAGGGSFKKKTI